MSKITTLEEIFVEQLKNLYSAETQLIDALPEMRQGARDPKLQASFQHYGEQTYRHADRIEQILGDRDRSPTGHKCDALTGLVKQIKRSIKEEAAAAAKDAALVATTRRILHYTIDGYACASAYASLLHDEKAGDLLQSTLSEETKLDGELTRIAETLQSETEALAGHCHIIC